jgi:ABC-type uncharacterized transport system ATPase subunit
VSGDRAGAAISGAMRAGALSLRDITKRFGGTLALDGASLDVRAGTLHALLGENGAGKTTLMRLAFGMIRPDAGTITVDGTARSWRSSGDALRAGVGMVHQHFLLVPAMTVAENIMLGRGGMFGGFDPRSAAERVRALGAETGLAIDPDARVADLPVGAQQRLEILKALSHDARVLILDEPTAVLSPQETQDLYRWLRRCVDDGRTVVLITHKVREALQIADDITVLRRGRTVLQVPAGAADESMVLAALLGESPGEAPGADPLGHSAQPSAIRTQAAGVPVLRLADVSVTDANGVTRLKGTTLDVRTGEIVGVAGVEGAGQLELLRVLAGRLAPDRGEVTRPPRLGFVPEDRQRDAVIPEWDLVENFALKHAGTLSGVMPWDDYRARAERGVKAQDVRTSGVESPIAALSGGNQQKFVLARELEGAPEALIVENPTRGLDVRATAQVLDALRAARDAGVAVVVHSSDLDELFTVSDRMVVCFGGTVREVAVDRDAVGRAMVGLT